MTDPASALLRASSLPDRWRGRERFVILEAGAGAVRTFVTAWRDWRDDPRRCARLHFIALGPLEFSERDAAVCGPGVSDLARQLAGAWPPPTRNLHRLAFEGGRVQLLFASGEPADWLREIVASVDAFLVSKADAGGSDLLARMPRVARALARLAASAATLAAGRIDATAVQALEAAGFRIDATPSTIEPGMRTACYAPRFAPRGAAARRQPGAPDRHAVIVGAGLAGCAAAWALAEQGWRSTVLERNASIAGEASGNPAGLFHGIVNAQDGSHARFNRAAALEAHVAATIALGQHAVPGGLGGLLQLVDTPTSVAAMRALLRRLALPEAYVRALDADEAGTLAGLRLDRPAWFYPAGGWIEPGGFARSFLQRAAPVVDLRTGADVVELRRKGTAWQLLGAGGRTIAKTETVVLANAGEALRLLGRTWPVAAVRGQISVLRIAEAPGLRLPRLPVTGAGYLLPEVDGLAIFGATVDLGDDDPAVRGRDHLRNLAQLARLAPQSDIATIIDPARLHGRTAWRWVSRDRLPLIGPVPLGDGGVSATPLGAAQRLDQPRFVPRERGMFIYTALGSRGITWAALGAQVLAASITGAPSPLEASLLDALDPARFGVRDRRRAGLR